jgi:hypothetical protein
MKLGRILKTDLCSKMEINRNKHKNTIWTFDYEIVDIIICFNQVTAYCKSNTPEIYSAKPVFIYKSKIFKSFYEARGHAETEIAYAMSVFKSTRFILSAELPSGLYEKSEYYNGNRVDLN